MGFRVLAFSRVGYPLLGVARLLTVVASLVLEHRLQGTQAQQLWHTSSVAPWHVGSSPTRD